MKYLSIREFVDFGYLQEVNRAFFHPRGLALEVTQEADGTAAITGVWDGRDDPEGFSFAPGVIDPGKALRMQLDLDARQPPRVAALGYWQQPIE